MRFLFPYKLAKMLLLSFMRIGSNTLPKYQYFIRVETIKEVWKSWQSFEKQKIQIKDKALLKTKPKIWEVIAMGFVRISY